MMFAESKVLLLNKVDLLPYVDFSLEKASRFARALNPELIVFPISCRTGEGLQPWHDWLRQAVRTQRGE